jgi:dTDP-6-deoxy-L-talose 4-dehydrogenase [NAD(P)+]
MAQPSPARVLVLGGTGYVGRHVCHAFAAAGYEVVVIARQDGGAPPGCRLVPADLRTITPTALADTMSEVRPAAIVNATGGVWGISGAEFLATSNAVAERLLPAMSEARSGARLIHLGTMMEYRPAPEGTSLDEDAPVGPDDPYGQAKLAASEAVLRAVDAGRVAGVVLRLAHVAGPGAPAGSLLGRTAHLLAAAARTGRTAIVALAPLRARRDYVDARDVADAVVLTAQREPASRVLNIGRGEAVPVRSLVDLLIQVSGVPAQVVERSPSPGGASNRTDIPWLRVDNRRAVQFLGWHPRRSLEDAITALWRGTPGGR